MARTIKIDNALQKRFSKQEKKKKKELISYFLIVCEGEKTEPNYFKSFPRKIGKIVFDLEFDGGGISTLKVVEKAIELRDKSTRKYDRVWAVFDRDSFKANSFNSAIKKAESNGIHCAWSNEAFELWYLLHFHNRTTPMSRDDYKKAIEDSINSKLPKSAKKFVYKKNDINFKQTLDKYGNVENAIKWARDLSIIINDEKFANHNPQTMVFKLVEELLGKSKKLNKELVDKFG